MSQLEGLPLAPVLLQNKEHVFFAGPAHPKVKQVRNLIDNTRPNPHRLFIIEGIWAHQKAIETNLEVVSFLCCPEHVFSPEAQALAQHFIQNSPETYVLSAKVFEKLSERDAPDGLLSVCKFPTTQLGELSFGNECLFIVLDGLEIPGNIGTIMRSADGAGADAILICNRRARLTHPKIVKGSMGAVFAKPVVECANTQELIDWLIENKFTVYLTDTRAQQSYFQPAYRGRVAIVAGSERYGITKAWYNAPHQLISIPMLGQNDSLNVAISTTVVLYEASMKQKGFRK